MDRQKVREIGRKAIEEHREALSLLEPHDGPAEPREKPARKQTQFRLSEADRRTLAELAAKLDISQRAVVSMALREMAKRHGVGRG